MPENTERWIGVLGSQLEPKSFDAIWRVRLSWCILIMCHSAKAVLPDAMSRALYPLPRRTIRWSVSPVFIGPSREPPANHPTSKYHIPGAP